LPLLRKNSPFLLRWGYRVLKRDFVYLLRILPLFPIKNKERQNGRFKMRESPSNRECKRGSTPLKNTSPFPF
jgi:hypothetical protein